MVLVGPENLKPKNQVVELTAVREEDGNFLISYQIHHPFTGKRHFFEVRFPRNIDPIDPIWDEVTDTFKSLFPRKENMLVYRDILRTLVIEEIYKKTKKPKKEAVKKEVAAMVTVPSEDREKAFSSLKELVARLQEMERVISDPSQPEAERKKAEIRVKAFRSKAESLAKELGIDLTKPLPDSPPKAEASDDLQKRFLNLKTLVAKIKEMEAISADKTQPESERKKAEIRVKAFKTKAETEAKALGIDLSQPLPDSPPTAQTSAPSEDKVALVKSLLEKVREMDAIANDESQPESEREKAKIRARAFRTKAEKDAQEAGVDITTL